MCGIIAVVRRRSDRPDPSADEVIGLLEAATTSVPESAGIDWAGLSNRLAAAVGELSAVDKHLRGPAGVALLIASRPTVQAVERAVDVLDGRLSALEAALDEGGSGLDTAHLETVNAELIRLRDRVWSLGHDRLRTAREVDAMAGPGAGRAAIESFTSVQQALSALDRLEVRGRDSAGLHLLVRNHGLDADDPALADEISARQADPMFADGGVRLVDGLLSVVYKAAAEIGELGDNVKHLRAAMAADRLLHRALSADTAETVVLGHTRWASVGIISEANAHPLNSDEVDAVAPAGRYCLGALNGDVDNYADLKVSEGLRVPAEVTTDAKVIPTLFSRRLGDAGVADAAEAFRRTVVDLEGSVAIGAATSASPDQLFLALRGSGQALYVGLADDAFIVASEPYGVVEETATYLRLDGETPADPDAPTASRGQIVVCDTAGAGTVAGLRRLSYDGSDLPITGDDLSVAEITTRDIDRGAHQHFFAKEVAEAPRSFRKTLRGRIVTADDGLAEVALDTTVVPADVVDDLVAGRLARILVIGQGTAAIAARSGAAAIADALVDTDLRVEAVTATELSGFRLVDDMTDTLIVAISQSGTTTDTNRTVDLVRARGARVIAIVNRRGSDLTDKADGVLYTSDGRDVEMSVASTKAFYAQIAAGFLLAGALAQAAGVGSRAERSALLGALRQIPDAMDDVLATEDHIAEVAGRVAPSRRYWAVVGNGRNQIAAAEVRIKLSELCYKSIACDATEDKKHIDLSCEPLILVCAAGLSGGTASDAAKEVAIFRAHKSLPVVIGTTGESRWDTGVDVLGVPAVHPALDFVLSAMAGHLFGYHAALAIDAQAKLMRQARGVIEAVVDQADHGSHLLDRVGDELEPLATQFYAGIRRGEYDGHLSTTQAVRLASLFRYATGVVPLDAYQVEYGKVGSPGVVLEDLASALSRGIDELTRPVDAIKHQAKTVTVGISRSDEALLTVPLVQQLFAAGASRDLVSFSVLETVAKLDPAVASVTGFTRYTISGDPRGRASIAVAEKGGLARDIPSRTEQSPVLRGTKQLVAQEKVVWVSRGASDGRTVCFVPEVKDQQAIGLVLLHVKLHETLPPATVRGVLQGYKQRYNALTAAVTETEPTFDDAVLGRVPVVDLLTTPVSALARHWRS